MKSTPNNNYHSKFNEKIFKVRLKMAYKKASRRELELTIALATQELAKRSKKAK